VDHDYTENNGGKSKKHLQTTSIIRAKTLPVQSIKDTVMALQKVSKLPGINGMLNLTLNSILMTKWKGKTNPLADGKRQKPDCHGVHI